MNPYIIDDKNGILSFTINRPDCRNAINFEIMDGLEKLLDLGKQTAYKALVITGDGDHAFCSGGDLSVFHQLKTEDDAYQMLNKMASILFKLLTFPKPTVAILNGSAVGGGCEIATACDFRLARKGIKAGFIQGKLAITTGWGGGTMLLEKLTPAHALQLLMTAEMYDAKQLMEMGFVHSLYDGNGMEAGNMFLEKMLKLETNVLSAYKKILINKWMESNLQKRIQDEVRSCAKLWQSDEHHIQVDRFLKKKEK